jgi:transcription elongation GreA/GreB family factor
MRSDVSRAFVKENDDALADVLARPVSEHPNDVTPDGLAQIEAALVAARAAQAAAQVANDPSAIAAALRDQRYWTARRSTAHVVARPADDDQVRFGHKVTVARSDGRKQTFQIVGEDEAEPTRGTLSHVSPLARALFGKVVGDVVPAGGDEAEILKIG